MHADIVTSRTGSVSVNRVVHGFKVALGSTFAASLFLRFQPTRGPFVVGLASSALAFTLPAYTYDAISLIKKDHSPKPYEAYLAWIWGDPVSPRCRLQFPLVTGFQMVLLFQALRLTPLPRPLQLAAGLLAAYSQCTVLWKSLSAPPTPATSFR